MSLFTLINKAISSNLKNAGINEYSSHFLLTNYINSDSYVIDLGANKGNFCKQIIKKHGSFCLAIEASPELYKLLPDFPQLQSFNYAVTRTNGPISFTLSKNTEANSLNAAIANIWGREQSIEVCGINFNTFLKKHSVKSQIDVLKIDIEGAEMDLLETIDLQTLTSISQITIEFHDFLDTSNEYKLRMKKVIRRLKSSDFLVLKISSSDWREVLFLNQKKIRLRLVDKVRLTVAHNLLRMAKQVHSTTSKFVNAHD